MLRWPYARQLPTSGGDACTLASLQPTGIVFADGAGWLAGVLVLTLLTLVGAASGAIANATVRVVFVLIFAVTVLLLVLVPFVQLLVLLVRDRTLCRRLSATYLTYVFFALQLAYAHAYWASIIVDPTSLRGVCTTHEPCTTAYQFVRVTYLSVVTFTSTGYGDIVPDAVVTMLVTALNTWSSTFFLGVIFDRIVIARVLAVGAKQ